jgi:predicted Zn-dependent peptidase
MREPEPGTAAGSVKGMKKNERAPATTSAGTTMSVETAELANGLRVATHSMPHLETASLGVWINTGARAELSSEHGVAHMLEHMAFKGTPRRPALAIAEEIEAVGGSLNASTSFETTDFTARVLKEDVPLALDIISDIVQHPLFAEKELTREKEVVLQEIASVQDSPEDLVFELLQEAAFPDQPLGRPVLGTAASVRRFRPENLNAYRRANYAGPSMVLAAAGAVDHGALVEAAEAAFSSLGREPGRAIERARYGGGFRSLTRSFEQCHLVAAFEAPSHRDPDFYAAHIYAVLLGGGMSSRLFQEARERRALCYDIHAFYWSYSDTGLFGVHSATGPEQIEELGEVVMTELEKIATEGPRPEEVKRAKAQTKSALLMSLESSEARAGQLARDILLFGRTLSTEELIERVEEVTPQSVRSLAERFCKGSPSAASVGPGGVAGRWRGMMETTR